ncbi:hypothetical protein LVB87_13580 [Lysobacter sp. KIS68-7]|uniref:hypothetical protein n=1 Tax=Lysobacter sp. KIS68-7 TaxID=2904252 RepID=UPI001E2FB9A1|nr:hypothetical protein [Lysobacter sp. KIS68-7]UHQ19203.1 hypothetical protein LVB87_13580 [Lysobacter sp. KIS68-7]
MDLTRWPQLVYAASSLPMAALTAFAAWLFFFVPGGVAGVSSGRYLVLFALIAYPLTLAMQVWATVGLYRQAKAGRDEPTARTRGLIGVSFLSLAGPVIVFLAYALMRR